MRITITEIKRIKKSKIKKKKIEKYTNIAIIGESIFLVFRLTFFLYEQY